MGDPFPLGGGGVGLRENFQCFLQSDAFCDSFDDVPKGYFLEKLCMQVGNVFQRNLKSLEFTHPLGGGLVPPPGKFSKKYSYFQQSQKINK